MVLKNTGRKGRGVDGEGGGVRSIRFICLGSEWGLRERERESVCVCVCDHFLTLRNVNRLFSEGQRSAAISL